MFVAVPVYLCIHSLLNCNFFLRILQVEALAVQLTQREGELIQEKAEVKKLANFLKQVSCPVLHGDERSLIRNSKRKEDQAL